MRGHCWQNISWNYKPILNTVTEQTAKKRYRPLEAHNLVFNDANDDYFGLDQWFLTASLQSIFCSTRLILIRNHKHCKIVTSCKTYFTLDQFTALNWRILPALIIQKMLNNESQLFDNLKFCAIYDCSIINCV